MPNSPPSSPASPTGSPPTPTSPIGSTSAKTFRFPPTPPKPPPSPVGGTTTTAPPASLPNWSKKTNSPSDSPAPLGSKPAKTPTSPPLPPTSKSFSLSPAKWPTSGATPTNLTMPSSKATNQVGSPAMSLLSLPNFAPAWSRSPKKLLPFPLTHPVKTFAVTTLAPTKRNSSKPSCPKSDSIRMPAGSTPAPTPSALALVRAIPA